jgi:AraC-like DNA-binding protein
LIQEEIGLGAVSYLDHYPLLRSRDSEFARDRLFAEYGADRFAKRGEGFGVRANLARLNATGIAFCAYDGAASLSFPESQIIRQMFSIEGSASFRTKGSSGPIEGWSPIITGDARLDLDFAPGYRQLVVRIDAVALERLLKSLLGDDSDTRLHFIASDGDPAVMTHVRQEVFRLAEELERFGQGYAPVAIAELERALMVRLLLAHRHNFSGRLQHAAPSANRTVVDIVQSYIEAHWDEPLDLERIAEVARVSVRTVFREFSDTGRGSPGQFARRIRLHRAAEMLRRPDEQTSVLAVAFKCGFHNLGRFASEYRREVGELPSETLRNARRRS